jgi:protein-L-isoaspartate(D-aspartate) O-methyltransferase
MHEQEDFYQLRKKMVEEQLRRRGIDDEKILSAFLNVKRHMFIPADKHQFAYHDSPVPIGEGQTISQPYIVALITQVLAIKAEDKVLEIGVGSGYQAAILACLGARVYGVERKRVLYETAYETLKALDRQVSLSCSDGSLGWQEHAPYDKIIVSAAAPSIAKCWLEQLNSPGALIAPVGDNRQQDLLLIRKDRSGAIDQGVVCACVFVPLIGKFGQAMSDD